MSGAIDELLEEINQTPSFSGRFKINDRVVWTVLRNSPKHYMPGEKLYGTVINAFDNAGTPTYRVRLDMVWNEHAIGQPIGEQIVIGNVRESSLYLLIE
jgi:hypothetical protein